MTEKIFIFFVIIIYMRRRFFNHRIDNSSEPAVLIFHGLFCNASRLTPEARTLEDERRECHAQRDQRHRVRPADP